MLAVELIIARAVNIGASITFLPTGGDPSTQQVTLRLKKRRTPLAL